jgi:hypothetical protein
VSKLTRREYWRQVRKRAFALSREHFAWTIPVLTYVVVFLSAWGIFGRQRAIDEFLKPDSLGLLTLPVIAIGMYIYNLFRAVADMHEEQMTAVQTIEDESKRQIAGLEKRIEQLTDVPDPLAIHFEPGAPPYEEEHAVMVGVELGGLRAGAQFPVKHTTKIFRIRVENTAASDLQNVSVFLSFEPARPKMSNLPLHLMHDNPQDNVSFQRSFQLPAFDHRFVDVAMYRAEGYPQKESWLICHIVHGVEQTLPVGTYNVVITVRANSVRPKEERFTIDAIPTALLFRKRDS